MDGDADAATKDFVLAKVRKMSSHSPASSLQILRLKGRTILIRDDEDEDDEMKETEIYYTAGCMHCELLYGKWKYLELDCKIYELIISI